MRDLVRPLVAEMLADPLVQGVPEVGPLALDYRQRDPVTNSTMSGGGLREAVRSTSNSSATW